MKCFDWLDIDIGLIKTPQHSGPTAVCVYWQRHHYIDHRRTSWPCAQSTAVNTLTHGCTARSNTNHITEFSNNTAVAWQWGSGVQRCGETAYRLVLEQQFISECWQNKGDDCRLLEVQDWPLMNGSPVPWYAQRTRPTPAPWSEASSTCPSCGTWGELPLPIHPPTFYRGTILTGSICVWLGTAAPRAPRPDRGQCRELKASSASVCPASRMFSTLSPPAFWRTLLTPPLNSLPFCCPAGPSLPGCVTASSLESVRLLNSTLPMLPTSDELLENTVYYCTATLGRDSISMQ